MEDESGFRKTIVGLVIAAIAVAVISFMRLLSLMIEIAPMLQGGDAASAAGTVTGHAFVITLIVWAILYFAYTRRRASEQGGLQFVILLVICLMVDGGAVFAARHVAEAQNAQMRIASQEINSAMFILSNPNGPPLDMTIHASGEAGEMERAVKMAISDLAKARTAYTAEMENLDVKYIMQPSRLEEDIGLTHTHAALTQARAALKNFKEQVEGASINFHRRVAAAKLGDVAKQQLLAGFDSSMVHDEIEHKAIWISEDGVLSEFQRMTDILVHPKGRWIVQGDNILFANKSDLAAYQKHANLAVAYQRQEQAAVVAAHGPITPPY